MVHLSILTFKYLNININLHIFLDSVLLDVSISNFIIHKSSICNLSKKYENFFILCDNLLVESQCYFDAR